MDLNFILRVNGAKKTGGPMAIFQLAECLISIGNKVTIWYDNDKCAIFFKDWHVRYINYDHEYLISKEVNKIENSIFILSETSIESLDFINLNNKIWMYMLSVDNCIIFGTTCSTFEGTLRVLKNCVLNLKNSYKYKWSSIKNRIDIVLSQSAYANNFLSTKSENIPYFYIGDFIDFRVENFNNIELLDSSYTKKNIIRVAYNPFKGRLLFKICKLFSKKIEFIPIIGIEPNNINTFLKTVDCFVDFGGQPGKDRLPREAIVAGIPAFQFRRGAAVNGSDFPCPAMYRLKLSDFYKLQKKIIIGLELNNKDIKSTRLSEIFLEKEAFYLRIKTLIRTL